MLLPYEQLSLEFPLLYTGSAGGTGNLRLWLVRAVGILHAVEIVTLECYVGFGEQLEIPSEQRSEIGRVLVMGQGGGLEEGGFHRREVRMILGVQALLLHPAPIAFDQVEVRRIRGQKLQVDAQRPGVRLHQRTPLVAGVVQKEGERNVPGGHRRRPIG